MRHQKEGRLIFRNANLLWNRLVCKVFKGAESTGHALVQVQVFTVSLACPVEREAISRFTLRTTCASTSLDILLFHPNPFRGTQCSLKAKLLLIRESFLGVGVARVESVSMDDIHMHEKMLAASLHGMCLKLFVAGPLWRLAGCKLESLLLSNLTEACRVCDIQHTCFQQARKSRDARSKIHRH